jgi:hypothetical protein
MNKFANNSRGKGSGFTLVEMMLVVAMTLVIVLTIVKAFDVTQKAFIKSLAQTDLLENGRGTISLISSDLAQINSVEWNDGSGVLRPSMVVTNVTTSALNLDYPTSPGGLATQQFYFQDFFFMKEFRREWDAVAYRVAFTNGVGSLYRLQTRTNTRTPDPTFYLQELLSINRNSISTFDHNNFSAAVPPPVVSLMAEGVVHFEINVYNQDGILLESLAQPSAPPYPYFTAIQALGNGVQDFNYTVNAPNIPSFAELVMGIMGPKLREQYAGILSPELATEFLQRESGNIQLFRTMFPLRNGNL